MVRIRKLICLLLALCVLQSTAPLSVFADEEDPQALKNLEEFGAVPEEPISADTEEPEALPEETLPEEPMPEKTAPAETEHQETQPEETIPEDTVPEESSSEAPPAEEIQSEETEPEAEQVQPETEEETVPLYFQTDYPNNMYGSGTIANNGCSVTCLAMVATYMTGHTYLPDELARYFGGRAENNIVRLEMGSDTLQLAWEKSENWHRTLEALHDGKMAIVLMGETSLFTQSQHFILLTGLTEEGRILVHDPNAKNYELWNLKKGFEEGFDESSILAGYSGGWIYDKEAMPEEPYIHYEPLPERKKPRYDIVLTEAEIDLLARVVWVESRGESKEGQQAVAEVVLNRMHAVHFPDSLYDVIYGEGQFRSVPWLEEAEPYQTQYEAIENAIYGPYILPENVMYFATFETNENVWGRIGGHIFCYG